MRLTLPANGWVPRPHQKPFWNYLEHGGRRASVVAHRRWGKDDVLLRRFSIAAFERVGNYWHLLPEKDQARKAIWNAVNPHTSKRRIDEAFPAEIRKRTIDQEMMIEFINGSTYQIGGSDRYDALVGSTPVGIAFSEWALSNPHSWAYLRPILLENNGWAAFITTPRGKNHAWTMHNAAVDDQTWFHLTSPATQTNVFSPEQLAQERTELIREHGQAEGEALYEQEYLCSFEAAIIGAYYTAEFRRLDTEKQIISVPWAPSVPVVTAWDIGFGDSTAIWFVQLVGREVHVIDYYEASGADIGHYAKVLKEKPYVYEDALLPHDAGAGELGTGKSISRMLSDLGVRNRVLPRDDVDAGIMQVRQLLPRCWFDAKRCGSGIEALRQYRKQYDEERKVFSRRPLHDWASHCFVGTTKVLTRYGTRQIMTLPANGEVLTPCGWKPYRNPRVTRKAAPLVEVRFAGGFTVKCTPDHLFATVNGWKSAESLTKGSLILSSLTQSRRILMAGCTVYGRVKSIFLAAAANYIAMFGSALLVLFRPGATSTIEMETQRTIALKTLSAYLLVNTFQSHGSSTKWAGANTSPISPGSALLNGTDQTKAGFGIDGMQNVARGGQSGNASRVLAKIVEWFSTPLFGKADIHNGSAVRTARPLRIESVRPLKDVEDVWCLTVDDGAWFSLSNGAVVHNCADAFRYLAMGLREEQKKAAPIAYPKLGIA